MTEPVTLDNCADEPIHRPGAIQPHGVLLVLRAGRLVACSGNIAALCGTRPPLGAALDAIGLPAPLLALARELLAELAASPEIPIAQPADHEGASFDVVVHAHEGLEFVEIERRATTPVAVAAYSRGYERIKRAASLDLLLAVAVQEVRRWTGFDRVMAYVFRHDESGDVVAEDRGPGIESFLGMRYPASDIPAQARRLYTLNTLRLIPDVHYEAVPLLQADPAPVDLSFSVLRSVSPIHVEYLRNMGIRASMSVSLVVQGRLWGLLACHHHAPLQVAYEARQACDVLAQLVASGVQALESRETAARLAEGTRIVGEVASDLVASDDPLPVLVRHQQALLGLFRAEGLVLTHQSRVIAAGGLSPDEAKVVAGVFAGATTDHQRMDARADWPVSAREAIGAWVGALGICYDRGAGACLVVLRREQVSTVRWAGKPEKTYVEGPNGPRLTPRGSFAEWQETVRDRSVPWQDVALRLLRQLHHELRRIAVAKASELESARQNLLATLGHDLRDPLQAMAMLAGVLKVHDAQSPIGNRLASTTNRMQRLVAQVLDYSRVEAGQALATDRKTVDVTHLVEDIVEEARLGHPGVEMRVQLQRGVFVEGDPVRLAQAVGNLLGNARHHGAVGHDIAITLEADASLARIAIGNVADPLAEELTRELFTPFKRRREGAVANRSGLGLGLYIASRIAREHGGTLEYRHEGGRVVFELQLPTGRTGA